jgi:alanine dehydrogenase
VLGRTQMPPKTYVFFEKYGGDFRAMPAYLESIDVAGVKIVNVHPENPAKYGLPTVMATIILLDPKNGAPFAIIDGKWITDMRTGAAGGIAAKYLAKKDSRIVSMIGTGAQARTQLLALLDVVPIEDVRAYSPHLDSMQKYAKDVKELLGIDIRLSRSVEEAVKGSDIIVTTTPVREPIVHNDIIEKGMHINAIGADAPGKEELDPLILKRAKIVVDDFKQAFHSGEINVPLSKGIISKDDIYAELGEIILRTKPGRISDEEITVFDSTGLAIQDIATAWRVYEEAKRKGLGIEIALF